MLRENLINSILVTPSSNQMNNSSIENEDIVVYSYLPFSQQHCHSAKPELIIGRWKDSRFITKSDLFRNTMKKWVLMPLSNNNKKSYLSIFLCGSK